MNEKIWIGIWFLAGVVAMHYWKECWYLIKAFYKVWIRNK